MPKRTHAGAGKKHTIRKRHWEPVYLAALRKSPRAMAAAKKARIDYSVVWERRRDDKVFAAQEQQAITIGFDGLKDEAVRRGTEGVQEVRYDAKGNVVATKTVFSDTLLLAALRYRETGSWRDRIVQETPADEFAKLPRAERKARLAQAMEQKAKPL